MRYLIDIDTDIDYESSELIIHSPDGWDIKILKDIRYEKKNCTRNMAKWH